MSSIESENCLTCSQAFITYRTSLLKTQCYSERYFGKIVLLYLDKKDDQRTLIDFSTNESEARTYLNICKCDPDRLRYSREFWLSKVNQEYLLRIENNERRILVTGSRVFSDKSRMRNVLSNEIALASTLVTGNAKGADRISEELWIESNLPLESYKADWDIYGKYAGMIRNKTMLSSGVDKIYAFWDGFSRGTKHTIESGLQMGIEVAIIEFTI